MNLFFEKNTSIMKLLSYVYYKGKRFSAEEVEDITQVENSEKSYYLFGVYYYKDINTLINNIKKAKEYFHEIKFNIIIGGFGLYGLDFEELKKLFPEINYIILGKGEKLLSKILDNNLQPGLYLEKEKIEPYNILPSFIKNFKRVEISFDNSRCVWNRCKFCHHSTIPKSHVNEVKDVFEKIVYNYNIGVRKFYFYDNFLIFNKFYKLLDLLLENKMTDINFKIFGVHVKSNYNKLHKYLPKFNNLISDLSVGYEFLDDKILRKYDKGITVRDILKFDEYVSKNNIKTNVYLLYGLPGANENNINNHFNNLKKINSRFFNTSFFLLNEKIYMFKHLDEFGIKLKRKYTLKDYMYTMPEIHTYNWDFETDGKSRKEVFEQYKPYMKDDRHKINYKAGFLNDR
ncbi:MAG: radical SAM protein [Candidatus Omnitrophica bacterium]|nr:radical SAM protein [Candidatus Omnitrophota bacterium]